MAEEAAGLARRLKSFLRRAAAEDPAARRRPRRRRPADLHRRLSALRHDDDRADLERPSADQRRRRTADRQRADRPHPAHADEPARLSRSALPSSGSATRSRGSTTCATIICSAPASSARSRKGARWFTDKMPLNETHLGLIGLIFPQAPIIHLLRHPLDVVLSVFSNHLTHGFYCAYDLTSIARHYVLVMDLVEHYRREMALQISGRALRGRDRRPGGERARDARLRRRALRPALPRFSRKPPLRAHRQLRPGRPKSSTTARAIATAHYRDELAPVIPILEPAIRRLGYTVE